MGTVAVKHSVSSSVVTAPPVGTVPKATQIYPARVTCVTPPLRKPPEPTADSGWA